LAAFAAKAPVAAEKWRLPTSPKHSASLMGVLAFAETRHSGRANRAVGLTPQELPFNELILNPKAAAGVV
jgi:hypothetical protein